MNYAQAIWQLYPDLVFGVDFTVSDNGSGPYISEWNNTEITQPTDAALLTAWAIVEDRQLKEADVIEFRKKDRYIRGLKQEIDDFKDEKSAPGCTQTNKDMIQDVIDNLQTECDAEALNRITLMDNARIAHGIGVATDFAEEIKKELKGNT